MVESGTLLLTGAAEGEYNSRLMSSTLPGLLDPWRAVDSRSVLAGRLPLSSFPRLRELLIESAGDASFRLEFLRDVEHRAVLHCEVTAILRLRCQRCLEALDHQVDASIDLALVSGTDEERQLPEQYEPLPVSERLIRPADLIEEELLLALPQIPKHDPVGCAARATETLRGPKGRTSPFSVLSGLKRGN